MAAQTPGAADDGYTSSWVEFSPERRWLGQVPVAVPEEPTLEAALSAVGNLARWRDEERALRAQDAERARLAWPLVRGIFLVSHEGRPVLAEGVWREPFNPSFGDSMVSVLARNASDFCSPRTFAVEEAAYLGAAMTPTLQALEGALAQEGEIAVLHYRQVTLTQAPDSRVYLRAYPRDALAAEIEGDAAVICTIRSGRLRDCAVETESPAEAGFGAAAQRLAQEGFAIDRTLPDGSPAEGRRLCLTIGFRLDG